MSAPHDRNDVAVVGGGPAGIAAAVAARREGASVLLIDAYVAPGGQIWRRRFDAGPDALPRAGRRAYAELAGSGVRVLTGTSVWAAPAPGTLLLDGAPGRVEARTVVLATGAYDRPVAFPGWTLPGAMTAGAAQALAKGQGVLPGRRVLLAGAGPFLLPVARQLLAVGAEVVVAEATRRRDWLRAAPRMTAYPGRLAAYAGYRTRVRSILWGHVIVRAEGDGRVESATLAQAGPDWRPAGRERTFAVDAVCTAYGFLPNTELARALGCELAGDAVAHDAHMRTSVAGVYVAGEAAGIGGADLAAAEGELAGAAAALEALAARRGADGEQRPPTSAAGAHDGNGPRQAPVTGAERLSALRRRRERLSGFAAVLGDLFDPRPGLGMLATRETVLCRCEDVTAGEIDAAAAQGATTPAELKIVTRCGQGPCQGRICECLVASRLPAGGRYSSRAPIAPVPLTTLMDA